MDCERRTLTAGKIQHAQANVLLEAHLNYVPQRQKFSG
jgi:hypothetical protein